MKVCIFISFRHSLIKMNFGLSKRIFLTIGQFLILMPLHCQPTMEQDKFKSLSNEIKKIIKDTKTVGVSVALIDNYKIVWAKGFGITEVGTNDSVTTETLFQAASISKSITAMAVMRKVQEKSISLTENIDKQLTSWHIPDNNFTNKSPITVKQLLSHTAGVSNTQFPGYHTNEKLPTIVQALNGESPAQNEKVKITFSPGSLYSYSNCGYWILALLLEDVEKKKFEKIIEEEIFTPLNMKNSTFDNHLPNQEYKSIASGHLSQNNLIDQKYYIYQPSSSGGLWSTPIDIAKFLIEMELSSKGQSNQIINEENTKLMLKPVMGQYALGFTNEIRGTGVKFFGHDGHSIGFVSSMIGSLNDGFGLVIMTNSENGWKAVNKIKKLVGRKFWGF
jgi:CubicO group peptidase (beta-lactamase class C family)